MHFHGKHGEDMLQVGLGTDINQKANELAGKLKEKGGKIVDAIENDLIGMHTGQAMLRYLCNGMIMHVLRGTTIDEATTMEYDKEVFSLWERMLNTKIYKDASRTLMELPMNFGGIAAGLMTPKRIVARIGSTVNVMESVMAACNRDEITVTEEQLWQQLWEDEEVMDWVKDNSIAKRDMQKWIKTQTPTQKDLTMEQSKMTYANLKLRLGADEKARLAQQTGKGTSGFMMVARGGNPKHLLDNETIEMALKDRLMMDVTEVLGVHRARACKNCTKCGAALYDPIRRTELHDERMEERST